MPPAASTTEVRFVRLAEVSALTVGQTFPLYKHPDEPLEIASIGHAGCEYGEYPA